MVPKTIWAHFLDVFFCFLASNWAQPIKNLGAQVKTNGRINLKKWAQKFKKMGAEIKEIGRRKFEKWTQKLKRIVTEIKKWVNTYSAQETKIHESI